MKKAKRIGLLRLRDLARCPQFAKLILGIAFLICTLGSSAATKQFYVEGELALGWPAQDSTVSQIFANQTIPQATTIYVWNVTSQQWDSTSWDDIDEAWLPNNLTIQSGRGFTIRYNAGHTFTVNYTARTNGTLSIPLAVNKWHYLSYGWDFNPNGTAPLFGIEQGWKEEPPGQDYSNGPHLY